MKVRNISQAKAELSALIEEVQSGNEVVLAKAGKPVAKLVAYHGPARHRAPSSIAGEIWIAPGFDEEADRNQQNTADEVRRMEEVARRVAAMPVLDSRAEDEILGYGPEGYPVGH